MVCFAMQIGGECAPEIRQRQFRIVKLKQMADKISIKLLFHLSVLFFAVCRASATIDVSLQIQLGNPSNASADTNNHAHYLIQRTVEAIVKGSVLNICTRPSSLLPESKPGKEQP